MRFLKFYLLIIPSLVWAQDTKTEMALYNMGMGSVFSGIGAVINKKPNEKFGNVLLKGMSQGALGGYLVYQSKNLAGKIASKERLEYNWAAKFVNAAGNSIIENAAANRTFAEQWHFNIGFNRIELYTKDRFKVKYKILPFSFASFSYVAFSNKFEFKKSLQTGDFIFSNDYIKSSIVDHVAGGTYYNIIAIKTSRLNDYSLFSHELIHVYQYYDFNYLNMFLNKPKKRWEAKSSFFKKINDIFYWDLQVIADKGLYSLENNKGYENNFFEKEADFWSNTVK